MASETRPGRQFYWSVRREVWEHRSLWIAPAVTCVAAVVAFVYTLPGLATQLRNLSGPDPMVAHLQIHGPYGAVVMAALAAAYIASLFYCLDALQGERRERAILFWKSMPVSDTTAVAAKIAIPLVVAPLIVVTLSIAAHVVMMTLSSVLLLISGESPLQLFHHLRPVASIITALYAALAAALWYAPVYGWALLMSASTRRAAALWAALPLLAVGVSEYIVFNTTRFFAALRILLLGWVDRAFQFTNSTTTTMLEELTPFDLLGTPSVWIGAAFTLFCVVAAIRLRRTRSPS